MSILTSRARAITLMAASYLVWVGSALAYHVRPFSEPETSFHLVRFSIALLAGIGVAFLGPLSPISRTGKPIDQDVVAEQGRIQ